MWKPLYSNLKLVAISLLFVFAFGLFWFWWSTATFSSGAIYPLSDVEAQYWLDCQEVYWLVYKNKDNEEWNGVKVAIGESNEDLEPFCGKRVYVEARLRKFGSTPLCRAEKKIGWCQYDNVPVIRIYEII